MQCLSGQIIPVDYEQSDKTELHKHYSQLSWWKKAYKSNPRTVYSFAGGASRPRDLCSKWGMWGKSCSRVGNFRNRRAATGVQTKVSEIEKGGELLLVHQFWLVKSLYFTEQDLPYLLHKSLGLEARPAELYDVSCIIVQTNKCEL